MSWRRHRESVAFKYNTVCFSRMMQMYFWRGKINVDSSFFNNRATCKQASTVAGSSNDVPTPLTQIKRERAPKPKRNIYKRDRRWQKPSRQQERAYQYRNCIQGRKRIQIIPPLWVSPDPYTCTDFFLLFSLFNMTRLGTHKKCRIIILVVDDVTRQLEYSCRMYYRGNTHSWAIWSSNVIQVGDAMLMMWQNDTQLQTRTNLIFKNSWKKSLKIVGVAYLIKLASVILSNVLTNNVGNYWLHWH